MNGHAMTGIYSANTDGNGAAGKTINPVLWHACAGPLVNMPPVGSLVIYFPQGHLEQVAAFMPKVIDEHAPSYPNLPSKLICVLHDVKLLSDPESDEVYAQMMLQPVKSFDEKALMASELSLKPNKPQIDFFCKTLTASDTSTHGGFSVPRQAAENIFPPLDFSTHPPSQELQARDLQHNVWKFRHIFRGQPKRHLLTSGWSLLVSGKRLFAGDAVLFARDEKRELLLGIRRAVWQTTNPSLSVLSSESMHIGILAVAARAAANNSMFTVFYNPRASPEFVVPVAKYNRATCIDQIPLGMRFHMLLETEELGTKRYTGTITCIGDLDPARWKNSQWRNLQVRWDESALGERRNRVSIWEIDPLGLPFFTYPPFLRVKRPRQPGVPVDVADDESLEVEKLFSSAMPLYFENCIKESECQNNIRPGLNLAHWRNMQQNPLLAKSAVQTDSLSSLDGRNFKNLSANDLSRQLILQSHLLQQNSMHFNASSLPQQSEQGDTLSKTQFPISQSPFVSWMNEEMEDISIQKRQQIINQIVTLNETHIPVQQQLLMQNNLSQHQMLGLNQIQLKQSLLESQHSILTKNDTVYSQQRPLQQLLQQNQPMCDLNHYQHQQHSMQRNFNLTQATNEADQQLQLPKHELQLLQKLHHQQFNLSQSVQQSPLFQIQGKHRAPVKEFMRTPQSLQLLNQKVQQQQLLIPEIAEGVLPEHLTSLFSTSNSFSEGTPSVLIDDIPSCSNSTYTVNSAILPQYNMVYEKSSSSALTNPNLIEEFTKSKNNVKLTLPIPISNGQGVAAEAYMNNTALMEYSDWSSTANLGSISEKNESLQESFHLSSFNQHSPFEDSQVENVVQGIDPRNNILFGVDMNDMLGISITTDPLLVNRIGSHIAGANFTASKDVQQELPSSIISKSFGVQEMTFNSCDSTLTESSILNRNSWGPTSQLRCMRTYVKVFKRGAVGRSIDITRCSSYDELKHDLALMFNIDIELEDWQSIGWKLVYVDHDNDILLVGDDPWENFVNCVRHIRILSPQEVQQVSLDADTVSQIHPNQACVSFDGGNAWKDPYDQNSENP